MPSDTLAPDSPMAPPVARRRAEADRRMRRALGLDPDGPSTSAAAAQEAFPIAIAISAVRCLISYIVLPVLGPSLSLSGDLGPVVGLVLGVVSATAIFFALRRFFGSDHRMRWKYGALAGGVLVLLIVQAGFDITALATR